MSGTGRETLGKVRDESWDPRGGPGRVGRHSGWSWMNRGTLGEVWDGSGTYPKVWDVSG